MVKAIFYGLAAVALMGTAALAQSIPRYHVEGYCEEVSEVSGGSVMIFNGCMDIEQQAYDALKSVWSHIPSNSQSYCEEVATVSGGSYSILKGCIDMETDAANSPRSFEY